MFYYFDPMYFLFMLPGLVLAIIAQVQVKSSFNRYKRVMNRRGLTGGEAARRILLENGIGHVGVERVAGNLTDHYDPRANVIRLSDEVYNSHSIAAVGIAAHEAGHAVQYAVGYGPVKLRMGLIPVCNFGAGISPYLLIAGFIFNIEAFFFAGIAFFALAVLLQLITLPVEFNASARAMRAIEGGGFLDTDEAKGARRVLTAAAMTYVAALLQSLLMLLYYIARFGGRRD